jgi:hypothetical protein
MNAIQISDEYIDRLQSLFENVRDNHFAIGDLLVELVDMHENRRTDVINYIAGQLAISPSTLYDYENTARRWTPEARLEYSMLDWTIYRNSDPIRDKGILDQCVEENWNATKFKENMFPEMVSPCSIIMRMLKSADRLLESELSRAVYMELAEIISRLENLLAKVKEDL